MTYNSAFLNLVKEVDTLSTAIGRPSYLNGPPDYYSTQLEGEPLILPKDLIGVVDQDWLDAMNALVFSNGMLSFGNVTYETIEPYYPVWVVPTGGNGYRARLDSIEVTAEGPDVEHYVLAPKIGFGGQQTDLQASDSDYAYDEFFYQYDFDSDPLYHGVQQSEWSYYTDYFPASATGGIQSSPLISASPAENVDPGGYVTTITDAPWACISLAIPLAYDATHVLATATDYEFTITGLRVERS